MSPLLNVVARCTTSGSSRAFHSRVLGCCALTSVPAARPTPATAAAAKNERRSTGSSGHSTHICSPPRRDHGAIILRLRFAHQTLCGSAAALLYCERRLPSLQDAEAWPLE